MKHFILLVILSFSNIQSFPGDQDPLSCTKAFNVYNGLSITDPTDNERKKLFAKGLAKAVIVKENNVDITYDFTFGSTYQTTNYPGLSTEAEYKAKIKEDASNDFKAAIRKFHDRSVSITKLGDSLSDFVDVYGSIYPNQLGLSGDMGTHGGGSPFFMEKGENR